MTDVQAPLDPSPAARRPRSQRARGRLAAGNRMSTDWRSYYSRGLLLTDLVVLTLAVTLAQIWKFGLDSEATANGPFMISYTVLGGAVVVMWWVALEVFQTRQRSVLGAGSEEYRRILRASVMIFGWIAIMSLIFKWDMSRGYLAVAFPTGLLSLLAGRKIWRTWLRRQQRNGKGVSRVLVIGGVQTSGEIARWFGRHPLSGYRVTGIWVPDRAEADGAFFDGTNTVDVVGNQHSLADALADSEANTVIVTDTEHLGHHGIKELTWDLEERGKDLLVSPNVIDVHTSRLHLADVAGLPLLHLEEPQYAGAGAWPKVLFDRVGAIAITALALPFMLAISIAVKASSRGPVLFYQERVGRDGEPFNMIKFRSMRMGTDADLGALVTDDGSSLSPFAKVKDDPRVTAVGRILRNYSLDELPQLFNVLRGDMSLVGPRPQRDFEVALYDEVSARRLRVRPGMTGLWQVSGRSDLSPEEAIRLDTYYVENWSMTSDLLILWRTVKAVMSSSGAY